MATTIVSGRELFSPHSGRLMEKLLERAVDRLDVELSRRRRELSDLWMIAAGMSGQQQASMCRVAHLAAYAHWEGFSKAPQRRI